MLKQKINVVEYSVSENQSIKFDRETHAEMFIRNRYVELFMEIEPDREEVSVKDKGLNLSLIHI